MNSMGLVDLKGDLVKSKPAKELLVIKSIESSLADSIIANNYAEYDALLYI
ncbi:hypothetical protein [Priestia aryabhattai]|uniref:hypothetical protein n=1 Tax=Priestia aryabhattai TaxID=412384 RepID=UPI00159BDCBD|nr:hypothetical protein [Priestia aryabhattai]